MSESSNTHKETQVNIDNRSNQLNPNNDSYWKSRGKDAKPDNKEKKIMNTKNPNSPTKNGTNNPSGKGRGNNTSGKGKKK